MRARRGDRPHDADRGKRNLLAKVFGRTSTGVVYLVSVAVLLLVLAGFVVSFLFRGDVSLLSLLGYAVFILFALAIITLPVAVQKFRKLYVPPAVEAGMCLYAVLYLVNDVVRPKHTSRIVVSFTPAIGGFFIGMAVFSVVFSLIDARRERQGRDASALLVSVVSYFAATLVVLAINLLVYALSRAFWQTPAVNIRELLVQSGAYESGVFISCLVGGLNVRFSGGERYRIRSFREADAAKEMARGSGNRSFYTVVDNISGDDTDYRKLYRSAKAKFFLGRIFYLVVYGVYVGYTAYEFSRLPGFGYAVIGCLIAGFFLTAALYVYEYVLYRRSALNQRLRKLKIIRSAVRVYSLALMIAAMVVANFRYNALSALVSVGMIVFNLCVLTYNLFGKPKKYPALSKCGTEDRTEDRDKIGPAAAPPDDGDGASQPAGR